MEKSHKISINKNQNVARLLTITIIKKKEIEQISNFNSIKLNWCQLNLTHMKRRMEPANKKTTLERRFVESSEWIESNRQQAD